QLLEAERFRRRNPSEIGRREGGRCLLVVFFGSETVFPPVPFIEIDRPEGWRGAIFEHQGVGEEISPTAAVVAPHIAGASDGQPPGLQGVATQGTRKLAPDILWARVLAGVPRRAVNATPFDFALLVRTDSFAERPGLKPGVTRLAAAAGGVVELQRFHRHLLSGPLGSGDETMAMQQPEEGILHPPRQHARDLLITLRIAAERGEAEEPGFLIVGVRLLRDDASVPVIEQGL